MAAGQQISDLDVAG